VSDLFSKFKNNPLRTIKLILSKTMILPIKYGTKSDYKAHSYWRDRFLKYNLKINAVGNEGLSEEDNLRERAKSIKIFNEVCQKEKIYLEKIQILEIGCGSGFYTQFLLDSGAANYTGVDITDVLFPQLKPKFPHYTFIKQDISMDTLEGKFDLIVMMDVIQHIVNDDKFKFTINNIKSGLSENGIFIVAPITNISKKHLFYVRRWSFADIDQYFPEQNFLTKGIPFRGDEQLLLIRKTCKF